jgi:nucleoside-diphosphate kinase
MIEKTLVLIKPDAMQRGIIGKIITRFERTGIKIVASKLILPNKELAVKHYAKDKEWIMKVGTRARKMFDEINMHKDKSAEQVGQMILNQLSDYLILSPTMAFVFEGHNVVEHVQKLTGATAPRDAVPGTIRGDYSFDTYDLGNVSNRSVQNLIHASDSVEVAKKEISLWFKPEEIHSWKRIDEEILYRGLENKE